MLKVHIFFLIFSIFYTNLFAVNPSYIKTKVKNRASLQKKNGAFKHTKYNYVSQKDINQARYKKNPNLGVVNVNRGDHIREVSTYVDSHNKIRINNSRSRSNAQIGVVNVGKNVRLKKANVVVRANKGIEIRQNPNNYNRTSQVGVVNLHRSSRIKEINTIVDANDKITIKNH
jgi:hypothetical protein